MSKLIAVAGAALLFFGCSHAPPKPPPPPPVVEAPPPPPPKEEPPEEMEVAGTLGTLSDEEMNGPFQARWSDITACYQEAKAHLWYLGGKVELKVHVGADGAPSSVYVSSSSIGNYQAERCILGIARELRFAKPHGGREAEFTYPIEFHARAAVQTWDQARVEPALHRHHRDLLQCRERSQHRPPSDLMLTVYVAPGGKVTSAGLAAGAPLDDGFATCLVQKTQKWRLDDPLGRIAKCTVPVSH